MVAIRNNQPNSITLNYRGGKVGRIDLGPGVTIGVDEQEWAAAKKHPLVKIRLEQGIIEPLIKEPVITSNLEGFEVVDDAKSGQPMPILATQEGRIVNAPKPQEMPRSQQLEELYIKEGFEPIKQMAADLGISKPSGGWKEAIPLIVEKEAEIKNG